VPEDRCISEKYISIPCGNNLCYGWAKHQCFGDRASVLNASLMETEKVARMFIAWRQSNSLKCLMDTISFFNVSLVWR
jgi:hypothetical protein